MVRSRARPKKRSGVKVKVKAKAPSKAQPSFFASSSLSYDRTKSQFSNYQTMGLAADSNQIGAARATIRGFKPRVKVPVCESAAAEQVHPLELETGEALKTYRWVPQGERDVLHKLIAAHGDDYAAMSRDMRLNQYQHTAPHLRRRIAKMRTEDQKDTEAAAAAAASKLPAPSPRLRKKITKNPNGAFKRRSTHFT
uniref:Nucleolar protein 16 n=1 Tax=Calcidiscus leptoporus TaxID=127549 RepID=A0A7S0ILE1_9EUKA|mmetsp:Transcript_12479/g.28791  ORF Transcript_12479/g.28791 Transcript_12479/m.28791 type:complete len:196 (+) Transcript_12479:38-625(+)